MRRLIHNDLKRIFYSRKTLIALILGMSISIWHMVQVVIQFEVYDAELQLCPQTVFDACLGTNAFLSQPFIYFLLLPFIAALPGSETLFQDIKGHYCEQVSLRVGTKKFLLARYIAVFISGGIVFITPIVMNIMVLLMKFPFMKPEPFVGLGPISGTLFGAWYYTHPFLYVLWKLLIAFIFAGGIAGIGLLVTYFVNYQFEVVIVPFALYFSLYCITNIADYANISPNYFLTFGADNHYGIELFIGIGFFALSFIIYMVKGTHYEK